MCGENDSACSGKGLCIILHISIQKNEALEAAAVSVTFIHFCAKQQKHKDLNTEHDLCRFSSMKSCKQQIHKPHLIACDNVIAHVLSKRVHQWASLCHARQKHRSRGVPMTPHITQPVFRPSGSRSPSQPLPGPLHLISASYLKCICTS